MTAWAAVVVASLAAAAFFSIKLIVDLIAATAWFVIAVAETLTAPMRKGKRRH